MALKALDGAFGAPANAGKFKDRLLTIGKLGWEASYKHGLGDHAAIDAIFAWADDHADKDPKALAIKAMGYFPADELKILAASRWYDQGLPRIVIEEKFAAVLMATDVGKDQIDLVLPPWTAFLVELPVDFLTSWDESKSVFVPMRHLVVQYVTRPEGDKVWGFVLESELEHGLQLFRHGYTTEQLLGSSTDFDDVWENNRTVVMKADDRDERILRLVGRLIVSLCLALSDPNNFHEQKRTKKRAPPHKRWSKEPLIRTYVVGRPVSIDCRKNIREWVEGTRKGSEPTVQVLVRGHWKRQAHGPQMSLRKTIHIEPYWRGPEDAAILTRTVKPHAS